jgi:peptide/nickel transport system substrate-binding protein
MNALRQKVLVSYCLLCLLFFTGLVAACGSPSLPPPPTRDPLRIIIGTTAKIRTLDPADADNFIASNILYNTTERLYTYKAGTTELVPQLATDFPTVSPDGLTYTIPVRTGIRFHDGSEFDASAMAFSLQRFLQLRGSPYERLSVIEQVFAPRPDQLVIKLKQPVSFFPALLAFTGAGAISPKSYSQEFLPHKIVGTGPYRLTEYKEGSYLKLEAFPDYWGDKPQNKGIDLQFYSSSANLLNAFKTGQVDVAFQTLSPSQVKNLLDHAHSNGWRIASNKGNTMLFMVLNLQQPPLDNPLVRQGIASAVDRELLQERVFQNQRMAVYSMIPSTFSAYQPVFQQYQPSRAQQLLAQAGFSRERPAQVSIWYSPRYGGNGDLVASYLKAVIEKNSGSLLRVKVERIDPAIADSFLDKGTYTYPIFLRDWVPDYLDPDNFIQPFLGCERADDHNLCQSGNTAYWGSFYHNPDLDKLVAQQRQTIDPPQRQHLLRQIQEIIAQDVPYIPLWQNREYAFAQPFIGGLAIEPSQQLDYRFLSRQP